KGGEAATETGDEEQPPGRPQPRAAGRARLAPRREHADQEAAEQVDGERAHRQTPGDRVVQDQAAELVADDGADKAAESYREQSVQAAPTSRQMRISGGPARNSRARRMKACR